jgi:hypothetical protein
MTASKTMSGARAKFAIVDPATGEATVMGIFSQVSWGVVYDAQPVFILGRYGPAEIEYTAQEAVQVTATGWRVIKHGPHAEAKVPKLQDLLRHEYITLTIIDRQSNERPMTLHKVRPTGYSTSINARGLEEITVNFMGIVADDESTVNEEDPSAANLP